VSEKKKAEELKNRNILKRLGAEWKHWYRFSLFNFSQALQPHMGNHFSAKQLL
jgi:hypothetical protein